jgi:hypothetical protein
MSQFRSNVKIVPLGSRLEMTNRKNSFKRSFEVTEALHNKRFGPLAERWNVPGLCLVVLVPYAVCVRPAVSCCSSGIQSV